MFNARLWLELLRATVSPGGWGAARPAQRRLLMALPAVAAWNASWMALDRLLVPGLDAQPLGAPVFIVANARSGTTFLHRLLAADEGRFVCFKAWEIAAPAYLQKRAVDALARLDAALLGEGLARGLRRWEDRHLAPLSGVHRTSLTAPEEDEFLLFAPMASQTLRLAFPGMDPLRPLERFDALDARQRERAMAFYQACIRRQLRARGPDARLLSKSPAFPAKLATLARAFPGGRFVHLVRDPFETIPSLLGLMGGVWQRLGVAEEAQARARLQVVDACVASYLHAEAVLPTLPEGRRLTIPYPRLVAAPRAAVEEIYDHFSLPLSPAFARHLDAEQARARGHVGGRRPSLAELGIDPERIAAPLAPLAARYGWDRAWAASPPP